MADGAVRQFAWMTPGAALLAGVLAVASSVGQPAPSNPSSPPAARTRVPQTRYAVALEHGRLLAGTDAVAETRGDFDAGAVLPYYGETEDGFGRRWQVVGDPNAWARVESWFAIPTSSFDGAGPEATISLIRGWDAPPPLAARLAEGMDSRAAIQEALQPIRVDDDWWQKTLEVPRSYVSRVAGVAALRAYRFPTRVAREGLALLGGQESLGPWPDNPGRGALHVAPLFPLVFRFGDSGWELEELPLATRPSLGLLGNQDLSPRVAGPSEDTGPQLACWQLVGAHDPTGASVGRIDSAPPPPSYLAATLRPDANQYLGLFDRTSAVWPVAPKGISAPRSIEPTEPPTGVVLSDESRRQAVYLQQTLPSALARELRGRELRLSVWARAMPEGDEVVSTTVSIELQAGSLRTATSGTVSARPTRLELLATIPQDADSLRVRLIPVDRSVAVTEGGSAVFDRAVLAPSSWPEVGDRAVLSLYRVQTTTYSPARRYTRARLAVSDRSPTALTAAWSKLASDDDVEAQAKMLTGMLQAGMTERQVLIAWGAPEVQQVEGAVQRWGWADRSTAFTADGSLLTWERRADPRLPRFHLCPGDRDE